MGVFDIFKRRKNDNDTDTIYYQGYVDKFEDLISMDNDSFKILDGDIPIMISAAHAVEQTRYGKIKYSEPDAGVIALALHDEIGCPAIIKTTNLNDDANFDETHPYRDFLKKYVREHGILCVLDLHQLAPTRKIAIDIGTGFGWNTAGSTAMKNAVIDCFTNHFNSNLVGVDHIFAASMPYTVSADVSKSCNIPCLQIEMNSRLFIKDYDVNRDSAQYDYAMSDEGQYRRIDYDPVRAYDALVDVVNVLAANMTPTIAHEAVDSIRTPSDNA